MAKKKHIPLFDDQLEMLELLTDQEVGQAVLAAMRFMRSGTETDLTGGAGVVYQVLRAQFIRTEQNRTRRNRTGREVETAAPEGALSHPPWMKCGLMFCRDARRWSPRPSSTFTRPGAGWWERPPCGTGRPPAAVRSPGSAGAGPRPRPRSPTPTA